MFLDHIFYFVKVVNITPQADQKNNRDGFDINAIAVQGIDNTTPVPEPSTMLGFGLVVMGLAGQKLISWKKLIK